MPNEPLFSVDDILYEVGYSDLDHRRLLHQTALTLLSVTVGTSILIFLIFPLFVRASFINPLNDLVAGVERIGRGDLGTPVPVTAEDEVGFLTRSFNRMGRTLQVLTDDLRHQIQVRQQAEATAQASADFVQAVERHPRPHGGDAGRHFDPAH